MQPKLHRSGSDAEEHSQDYTSTLQPQVFWSIFRCRASELIWTHRGSSRTARWGTLLDPWSSCIGAPAGSVQLPSPVSPGRSRTSHLRGSSGRGWSIWMVPTYSDRIPLWNRQLNFPAVQSIYSKVLVLCRLHTAGSVSKIWNITKLPCNTE